MKKIASILLAGVTCLGATACTHYTSSYDAKGFYKSNSGSHCEAKFELLSGRYVFNLKSKDKSEGELHYTATLEEGELNVYYDGIGVKELLFNIKAGESLDDHKGYWESGKTVYVILETVTDCRGEVTVELN